ncbi:MAG: ComEC/Rec2 family competence protein [Anaerolineae bacterium]|nr:ComEC/Rec2 family competence protein [Anaerolineae bacterium]
MLLIYLTAAWLLGIFLARLLWAQGVMGCACPPAWARAVLLPVPLMAALLVRRRPQARLAALLLFCALLGAWRYQSRPFQPCFTPDDLAFHNGNEDEPAWVTVEGIIVGYPDVRDRYTNYRLQVHTLESGSERRAVRGTLLLQAPRYPEFQYGDELRVRGALQTPPVFEDFSYKDYLARQGIHSLLKYPKVELLAQGRGSRFWAALYGFRRRASQVINRLLPEPQAALLNGILLGLETGIPRQLADDFNRTGTSHIIVISGFNVTIIAGLLAQTLGRLVGKRRAVYPVVGGIVLYTLLVGADAAVTRAAIMGILYVVAIHLGRQSTALVSLFASAWLMTAINPLTLWDAGFQLSFMATLGLILFTPALQGGFERLLGRFLPQEWLKVGLRFLNDALIVTLAAQITTSALIVYTFGRLSLISPLVNFLILPFQPPIMICGGLATLAGLIWLPLGQLIAAVPWLFLTYTVAVVEWAARLPLASLEVGVLGRSLATIYYALLFAGLGLRQLWPKLEAGTPLPSPRAVGLAVAVVIPLWLGATALGSLPDGRLHVWFIGLGESDAALVQTPGGRRVLLDAGRGEADVARALRTALPGWGRSLDLLVLTQADAAHSAPLADLLARYRVAQALLPEGVFLSAEEAEGGRSALPPANSLAVGMRVQLDEGVLLEVLHAPQRGSAPDSAVLRLSMGRLRLLLPSEIEQETQAMLLAGGMDLAATALKTPHAGTGNWPTAGFLAAVRPQLVVVPEETTYPPDVQERLQALPRVEADPFEAVELISDGQQLWVKRHGPGDLGPR